MLKKSNGFFLTELLLSLTAWLLIAGVVFPLIMKARNQSIQVEQEYVADNLLYERLITAKKEGFLPVHEVFTINQTKYEINQQSTDGQAKMEVCIQYVDVFQRANKKCENFE